MSGFAAQASLPVLVCTVHLCPLLGLGVLEVDRHLKRVIAKLGPATKAIATGGQAHLIVGCRDRLGGVLKFYSRVA